MLARFAPALTIVILIGPVVAGLAGVLAPAFGYLPALGRSELSLDPWRALFSTPGLTQSIAVSLFIGFGSTAISLAFVILVAAAGEGTRAFALVRRLLSPLLAVPHVAVAIGLAFVIAPSGLVFRIWGGWLGGPQIPPDILIVNDPYGLSVIAALALKEIPFLFLMVLAAKPQADVERSMMLARSMGYGRVAGWLKAVWPRIYAQIRLPVLAVLAYGLSVVDVALVLGPNTPPTLPVQILKWINDPDLSLRFQASAAAVLQMGLVAIAIAVWIALEKIAGRAGRRWIEGGRRRWFERSAPIAASVVSGLYGTAAVLAATALLLWSIARGWRYPDPTPSSYTLENWTRESPRAAELVTNSLLIGLTAAAIALVLTILCLENETRRGERRRGFQGLELLYVPLVAPQISFLLGLQILSIWLGVDESFAAVAFAHLVFVLPYVFLSISDPWRAVDPRYRHVALGLGVSENKALLTTRLPMLLPAVLSALALGLAVSIGQYLATVLIAGARWPTITTEAVTLASGGDRRIIAVYAVLQMLLPFVAFWLALAAPRLAFRNRRGMGVS
ncbi:MAG: ABC transporter permease [Pseudomonadota bacterium]